MNFVKWLRKNNRKVMTFVVIFCMVSFVVGYTGIQIIGSYFDPNKQTAATYDDGRKIKLNDLQYAQHEMDVLRMLMADRLLMGQGMSGALLAHLLFPDSQLSTEIAAGLKQAAQRGQIQVSMDELDAYFGQQPERSEELWILLKAEAYRAGYTIANEDARQILRAVVPQIIQIDAAQLVGQIVNKSNLTEDQIVRIFADLLSILDYANQVMNNQAVTLNQVRAFLGRSEEHIAPEFVKISADSLVDPETPISDADIQKQFEAFKQETPNNPTDKNPFGFGYQLPKRVRLEYLILQTDDVRTQIEMPTSEAMEEYYSSTIERFQTSEPSDPNNPESEKITHTRPYAEVESEIRQLLEADKITKLGTVIFNELKDVTEAGFAEISFDEATSEQLQLAAGDYETAAKQVSEKYHIPVSAGKTGWLSPEDFRRDTVLTGLSIQQQRNRIALSDLAFSASPDAKQKTRRIGLPPIRVWQNISLLKGGYYSEEKEKYYPLMAMVRVIDIQEPMVPETVDVDYNTTGVTVFEEPAKSDMIFSLKEKVKDDLRLQKAMEAAKARAGELATLVQEKGWDDAIAGYNKKYADGKDPNEIQKSDSAIKLESLKQQTRISQAEMSLIRQYMVENPAAAGYLQQRLATGLLNNKFYELLKKDSESTGTIHEAFAFEPLAACYVVKSVVRQPATLQDYMDSKAQTAMQLSMQDAAELALIHFNTQNILKRMNFERKEIKQRMPVEETPIQDVEF